MVTLQLWSIWSCCLHVEFPPETEDDLYQPYDSAMQMLVSASKKEESASAEQQDDEVKLNSKKRKAAGEPGKKDKVCNVCANSVS